MGPFSSPSRLRRALLAAGALLWAAAGARADADWSGLIAKSPFGAAAATGAGPEAPTELEFRGVVAEGGVHLVNLYDPATKQARWLAVHAVAEGLEVLEYDPAASQVKVAREGRVLTLPLKQARVALQQAAPATPAKEAAAGAGGLTREERRAEFRAQMRARLENGGPPPPRNLSPEDQAVIQEIRRRRALRDGNPSAAAAATPAAVATSESEPPPPPPEEP